MNKLLLMITNTHIPDVNFDEKMDKFNPNFSMELLRGFILPLGITIIIGIIIINCCKYYKKNHTKAIIQNIIIGCVMIVLLMKPSLLFQLGERTIEIFSMIIGGFLKNVK